MACLETVEYTAVSARERENGEASEGGSDVDANRSDGAGIELRAEEEGEAEGGRESEAASCRPTEEQCAICLAEFEHGEMLRKMPW